jgi:hypothetical protein
VIEPALKQAHELGISLFELLMKANQGLLMMSDGELSAGMDQLEAVEREFAMLGSLSYQTQVGLGIATIYARIATGEIQSSGSKLGTMMRNPGFALGRARKASQTAHDRLRKLSAELPADLEGFRGGIEIELAKVLAKRKERDEARKHIEKAIAFLQPMGDCKGMRDARALLASLDQK